MQFIAQGQLLLLLTMKVGFCNVEEETSWFKANGRRLQESWLGIRIQSGKFHTCECKYGTKLSNATKKGYYYPTHAKRIIQLFKNIHSTEIENEKAPCFAGHPSSKLSLMIFESFSVLQILTIWVVLLFWSIFWDFTEHLLIESVRQSLLRRLIAKQLNYLKTAFAYRTTKDHFMWKLLVSLVASFLWLHGLFRIYN